MAQSRPGPDRVAPLDGIRGFAILLIVFGHLVLITRWAPQIEPLPAVRSAFHLGVDLMFIVSGFLLFLPVVTRGGLTNPRVYALRRLSRILPGYYLVLVVALLLLPVLRGAHGLGDAPTPDLGVILSHLAFLEWQLHPGETGFRMVGSVWMICVLVPFYILFPLVAGRYLRHPFVGLVLGLAIATAWWMVAGRNTLPQVLSFTDDFAVGMTAAWLYVRIRRDHEQRATELATPVACASGAGALAVAYLIGLPIARGTALRYAENPVLSMLLALTLGAFVLSVPFAARWLREVFSNRPARWTGEVSYGVFLFHGPIIVVAMKLGFAHDGQTASLVALTAFVVPLSFLAGWLMFRYVEKPVRDRVGLWADRREPGDSREAKQSLTAPSSP